MSSLGSPATMPDWKGMPRTLKGTFALKRGFCCSSRNFREAFIVGSNPSFDFGLNWDCRIDQIREEIARNFDTLLRFCLDTVVSYGICKFDFIGCSG